MLISNSNLHLIATFQSLLDSLSLFRSERNLSFDMLWLFIKVAKRNHSCKCVNVHNLIMTYGGKNG